MEGQGVVMVGGGGHALVCIEVLRELGCHVVACLSDDPEAAPPGLDVPIAGGSRDIARLLADAGTHCFVAVGDNRSRARLTALVVAAGGTLVPAVSANSVVSPTATIGPGALVMPGAVVNAWATVGAGAIVNTRASIDHECSVGDWSHVGPGATLAGNVTVGEGALVGVGVSVIPGRMIGAWSTVGAGAAVVRDVEPSTVVAGVPATVGYAGSGTRK
ncbi:MAG: acetyltransferase [Actinomycetota bacterium]|nr:acetyltransferase [Actinomycetota bacterium]